MKGERGPFVSCDILLLVAVVVIIIIIISLYVIRRARCIVASQMVTVICLVLLSGAFSMVCICLRIVTDDCGVIAGHYRGQIFVN